MTLSGRTAVVTGASRGIGEAVARALAAEGASLVLASTTQARVEAVAESIRAAGGNAWGVVCDVADPSSVDALARAAADHLDRVDILVNNAGIATAGAVHRTSVEEWTRVLGVNATGTFLCARAFLPGMLERRWGRVVNVASTAGLHGARYVGAYAASKHAVIGLTRCAAAEAASSGVTVNAVCPGYADTDMTRQSVERIVSRTGMAEAQALEALLATSPQKRLVTPEEVAAAVVYLCGEAARGINGQALVIDGGGLLS
jgi:3-hydroxybutyrate dehydrogenase